MRLFFALEPDTGTATAISDWRDRNLPPPGRPVPPRNFHITLAFLGNCDSSVLPALYQSVDEWLENHKPQADALTLDRVGYWPKPGIFWLGPEKWPESLESLAKKLNHIGMRNGASRDRNRFQPHVTLFRKCQAPPHPDSNPLIDFPYGHFCLFESRQGATGVSYHSLCEWELADGDRHAR